MVRSRVTKSIGVENSSEKAVSILNLEAKYKNRKLTNFDYIKGFDRSYLIKVIDAIEIHSEVRSYSTGREFSRVLKGFLIFLSRSGSADSKKIIAGLNSLNVLSIDPEVAHKIELDYLDSISSQYGVGSSTLASKISSINQGLFLLASRMLWPSTLGIPLVKIDKSKVTIRPSLLEAIGSHSPIFMSEVGLSLRGKAAIDGLKRINIAIPVEKKNLSDALLEGERVCLAKLNFVARSVFDRSYEAWSSLQDPIAQAKNKDGLDLINWFNDFLNVIDIGKRDFNFERSTSRFFQKTPLGLARFLALTDMVYMEGDASLIRSHSPLTAALINDKLTAVARRVVTPIKYFDDHKPTGLETVRSFLTSSHLCVGSVGILVMLETGINTSPLISLPWDQVLPTSDPHWISIASWKERARGTLIEEELFVSRDDELTSAGSALLKLRKMSTRHEKFVGREMGRKPFVFEYASCYIGESSKPVLSLMTPELFSRSFASISKLAFGSGPVPTPSAVRPSFLMVLNGKSRSVNRVQAAAGHKSANTTINHYVGSNRLVNEDFQMSEIRTFQERFESVVVHNANDLADHSKYNGDLDGAINTGLGVLCTQNIKATVAVSQEGCMSLESCPNCRKVRVSTKVEDLADLLAFGEHLASQEAWLQTHRPEAWLTRWLYWSLLIEEVKHRGSRSVWVSNLKAAQILNDSREKPKFPPLW